MRTLEIAEDLAENECYFAGSKVSPKEKLESCHGLVVGRLLHGLGAALREESSNTLEIAEDLANETGRLLHELGAALRLRDAESPAD